MPLWPGRIVRAIKLAIAFLTIVPVRFGVDEGSDTDLARSRLAYPLVGALIGLGLAGFSRGLSRLGAPPGLSAFLLLAAGAILTGGLHLDGLADTADGLFLAGDRSRRLDVMRDPRVGSYGLSAVVFVVLGKYAVLNGLADPARSWTLFQAVLVSRSLILVTAGLAPYARPQGTGRFVIEATTLRDACGAAVGVLIAGTVCSGSAGLAAVAVALGLTLGLTRLAWVRLSGVTGDILGALVETTELAVMLTLALMQARA